MEQSVNSSDEPADFLDCLSAEERRDLRRLDEELQFIKAARRRLLDRGWSRFKRHKAKREGTLGIRKISERISAAE